MKRFFFLGCTSLVALVFVASAARGQVDDRNGASDTRALARLVWQDMDTASLKWGDLQRTGNEWKLQAGAVEAFPKLDPETQNLVQMEPLDQLLVVGIHDQDKGKIGSGWVAIASGVEMESHGDHFHAHYGTAPRVVQQALDDQQGNPAHVYRYDETLFIANDAENGFTTLQRTPSPGSKLPLQAKFYSGGGNHITLAAVANQWCYSTWADRDGDHVGRVDVVPIGPEAKGVAYSMQLPSGGLHGATANSGKVFFAPMDGVYVLDTQRTGAQAASPLKISLGQDPNNEKPYRTGAFANHRDYVLCVYGAGAQAKLGCIHAKTAQPKLLEISLEGTGNLTPSTPQCVTGANGKQYAWVVLHSRDGASNDVLVAIDLDPNGDQAFGDAKIHGKIELGKSKIQGHSGYHEIEFLPNRRTACITNPGDGSLWVMSIHSLEVLARLQVDGAPTRITAFGD